MPFVGPVSAPPGRVWVDAVCRPGKRSATGQGVVDAVCRPGKRSATWQGVVDAICRPDKRATGRGMG
ncbi:TPA: hypothetical protein QH394_002529 [Klebsiella aerogenes]|nr:hypothetical protein [Klebsiella aerogenes]HDT5515278.1 hypothetical protein [Klebsiella aerogenes]